jgi:uncharacterized membrane protein
MEMKRHKLDQEMIISCGVAALIAAIGIIFAVIGLLSIDLGDCDSTALVTIFFVLSGGIWGILLCRNC